MSVRIFGGDCTDVLKTLPDDSVHCVVTSPPYWGLRDYGIPPSIWGGDPACVHDFAEEVVDRSRATPGISGSGINGDTQATAARFEKRSS